MGLHRGWLHGVVFGLVLLTIALLAGCASPAERYVRADAKTFNAVAPELSRVDRDATALERMGWRAVVDTWRARIEEAAAELKIADLALWPGFLEPGEAGKAPPTQSEPGAGPLAPGFSAADPHPSRSAAAAARDSSEVIHARR